MIASLFKAPFIIFPSGVILLIFLIISPNVNYFHRSRSLIRFDYKLSRLYVQRVNQVQYLGIVFVPSLNFGPHIDYIMTGKVFRVLGFIRKQ